MLIDLPDLSEATGEGGALKYLLLIEARIGHVHLYTDGLSSTTKDLKLMADFAL